MCDLAESDHWDGILVHFYMPNTPNVSLSLSLSHTHTHTHTHTHDFPGVCSPGNTEFTCRFRGHRFIFCSGKIPHAMWQLLLSRFSRVRLCATP